MPIDYSKSIIYKLEHPTNQNFLYVHGSTCFDETKTKSRFLNSNDKYYIKLKEFIKINGGWNKIIITKIKNYPCFSRSGLYSELNRVLEAEIIKKNITDFYIIEKIHKYI
jgi:hypothetical protein